ncbi:MAG TPA: transglutaminase domain-containing protein [Anaeromyxobacteraceae bacterium]|nr:transglutaminase domain-containing protein [Anaeromyxobacteraceae bacterium]
MTAVLLALALGTLPQGASQRYRVELGGEHVGYAALAVSCETSRCDVRWESRLRAPAESGGGLVERNIAIAASREGFAHRVHVVVRDTSGERVLESHAGPVPVTLAEIVLGSLDEGEHRCIAVRDEQSGKKGDACATRVGAWIEGTVLGQNFRARVRPDAAPEEVLIPDQRMRYVADAHAAVPVAAPRLFGSQVRVDDAARPHLAAALGGSHPRLRFCGIPADPRPLAAPAVPREWPEGGNCRDKTTRYLAVAQAAGLQGRHVVGIAWDGAAFSWHEWAELHVDGRWVPIDPSFRQVPAEPPRFSLARFTEADEEARVHAGSRILSCWGVAEVEPGTGAVPARGR